MVKLAELLKEPFQDKQWPAKIAIGGVVFAVPVLSCCAMGYILNVAKNALRKKEERLLPEWSNWGKLFTDGILYCVIAAAYMLVPFLIFMVGAAVGGSCPLGWIFGAFVTFLAAVAALGAGFILPMAVCSFAATDDFKSAFAWKAMQEKIRSTAKDYAVTYLIGIGLFIAGYIVSFVLGLIIIGWILMPFLFFYLDLVIMRMFAEIYPQGGEEEKEEENTA